MGLWNLLGLNSIQSNVMEVIDPSFKWWRPTHWSLWPKRSLTVFIAEICSLNYKQKSKNFEKQRFASYSMECFFPKQKNGSWYFPPLVMGIFQPPLWRGKQYTYKLNIVKYCYVFLMFRWLNCASYGRKSHKFAIIWSP